MTFQKRVYRKRAPKKKVAIGKVGTIMSPQSQAIVNRSKGAAAASTRAAGRKLRSDDRKRISQQQQWLNSLMD